MAETGKGKIMGQSGCEWARERLPLLVGDADCASPEGNDLEARERARIEQHLVQCSACRQQRANLEQTMSILGLAAAESWAGAAVPSLLPGLEERIQEHQARSRSQWWRRFVRRLCSDGLQVLIDRLSQGLRDELPLRLAWSRDSLTELLDYHSGFARAWLRSMLSLSFLSVRPMRTCPAHGHRLAFGLGLVIVAVTALLTVSLVQHQRSWANANIAAAAKPLLPPLAGSSKGSPEVSEDVVTATASQTRFQASSSLAQADPASAAEPAPALSAANSVVRPAGTATAAATATPSSSPRYDFDLEHGTPMPPETRGGKPAY